MAKKIPAKEFIEAVKSLNEVLENAGEDKIKIVGVKRAAVVEEFTNCVLNFIDEDKAADLPDNVIDMYNDYIAVDEGDEEEESEKKSSGKKGSGKKGSGKKESGKKDTQNKSGKDRQRNNIPSEKNREKSCVEALKKGGSFESVVQLADDIYVKAGGKSNISQSKRLMERGIKYLYHAGVLSISDKGIHKLN